MLLSYNWLKDLTNATLPPQDLANALTRVGLNVEDVTPTTNQDFTLNADITTNRPDWLCHIGVAHEIAATLNLNVNTPLTTLKETGPDVNSLTSVTVQPGTQEHCPRYTLRVIQNVKVGPSPEWLKNRLTAIGQRSINNIVDITNLVCFEMNQPLHAFDMDKLAEKRIVLRMASPNEEFDAITGEHVRLDNTMLTISDAQKTVALAGVKGGTNTEVDANTTNVLLESAWFQPRSVRHTAKKTRLSSESSYRYERGIDPGMTERASARAASLILELAGGTLAKGAVDTNPSLGLPWDVSMRFSRCNKVLGVEIKKDDARRVFAGLGLKEKHLDDDSITVQVPSFRQDLKREIDLIEEVIRLVGYEQIPEKITMPLALAHQMPETRVARSIRRTLIALGYHECVTDAFVPREWAQAFRPDAQSYEIRNPINAERPVMRAALAPSLLEVRRTNRMASDVMLFEIGRTYQSTANGPEERTRLAILDDRGIKYARGALETVIKNLGLDGDTAVVPQENLPGIAKDTGAAMTVNGSQFATIGQIAKAQADKFDLTLNPAIVEADVDFICAAPKHSPRYRPLPRFPGVRRDISLAVPEDVRWGDMEQVAKKAATMLDSMAFESLYRGKGLKPGAKGMAFSMHLRAPDRSLTDAEANAVRDNVVKALTDAFPGSELR